MVAVVSWSRCVLMLLRILSKPLPASGGSQPADPCSGSLENAASSCSAACSLLQCLQVVQQLHNLEGSEDPDAEAAADAQQPTDSQRQGSPARFAAMAIELAEAAVGHAGAAEHSLKAAAIESQEAVAPSDSAVHAALWLLHSRLAQLVHFSAAAEDSPLVQLGDEQLRLLCLLSDCISAAVKLRPVQGTSVFAPPDQAVR